MRNTQTAISKIFYRWVSAYCITLSVPYKRRSSINVHHKCTYFDSIKDLRIAVLPEVLSACWLHDKQAFTSWNFESVFNNRAHLLGSFVNHIPSILNLVGFHSNFMCGMYLMLQSILDPNHTTVLLLLLFCFSFFNTDLQSRFISKIVEDPNRLFECFTLSNLK